MNIEQSKLIVTLKGKNAIAVASLEEAVSVAGKFRDTADYGFSIGAEEYYRVKAGRVFQGTKRIAQVHYNGRIELVTVGA